MNEKECVTSISANKMFKSFIILIGFIFLLISAILSPFESYMKLAILGVIFTLFSAVCKN